MKRNIDNSKVVIATLILLRSINASVFDYAGGYGILTRLLRDIGVKTYCHDPFADNLLPKGFELLPIFSSSLGLVTAFEVLQHFVNPLKEFVNITNYSCNILCSTELVQTNNPPSPSTRWYYGLGHGNI